MAGLDRVLFGGEDIGFKSPAMKEELNLVKLHEEWLLESIFPPVKSMTGDILSERISVLQTPTKTRLNTASLRPRSGRGLEAMQLK